MSPCRWGTTTRGRLDTRHSGQALRRLPPITNHFSLLTGNQGRGCGVGRTLGGGFGRGVGVGRIVAVGVAVGVELGVGLGGGVTVAVAVAVGVGVGLAGGVIVGVGVPPPPSRGAWISTVIGDPVLKYPTVALVVCGG